MVQAIFGPTLLSLANNVGTGISEVSFIFTSFNLGLIIGGIAAGFVGTKGKYKLFIYGKTKKTFNTNAEMVHDLVFSALAQFLMAIPFAGIAFATTLWLLLLLGLFVGLFFGYLDASDFKNINR